MLDEDLNKLCQFVSEISTAFSDAIDSKTGSLLKDRAMFGKFSFEGTKVVLFLPVSQQHVMKLHMEMFKGNWKALSFFKKQAEILYDLADELEYDEKNNVEESRVTKVLKKHTNFEGVEGDALILRIIAYYVENSCLPTYQYINRFLDDRIVTDKFNISLSGDSHFLFLRFEADKNLFLEHFIYYIVNRYSYNCKWIKVDGNLAGSLYKHHLVVFNDWIAFEQDALKRINLRVITGANFKNVKEIEFSNEAGVDVSTVFKRSVARYVYSNLQPYLLFRNNCEHFGRYCFLGSPASVQVKRFFFITIGVTLILNLIFPLFNFSLIGKWFFWFCFYGLISLILASEFAFFILWINKNETEEEIAKTCYFDRYLETFSNFPK